MEIRSVTMMLDPAEGVDQAGVAAEGARQALSEAGYSVQTIRLATTPFPSWCQGPEDVDALIQRAVAAGFDYVAIGPVRLEDDSAVFESLPQMIGEHEQLFSAAEIADTAGRIDTGRVMEVAEVIMALSRIREDGFANLYFTAIANCRSGSPFFPVSYHGDGSTSFAIAVEAADLAVGAIMGADSLPEARDGLVKAIEQEGKRLVTVARGIERRFDVVFGGIDFTLAPYPEEHRSLGAAMEALGVPRVGGHGSLFAAAVLAESIDRADFPRCGFSGLMFPVLEDAVLARRVTEGVLAINDLLLYSAVCGTGLDTLPLPGDVGLDELLGLLLDLAALAVRLDKPLTARLMPLPSLATGDVVSFDFPYFADSRVMGLKGMGLRGMLAGKSRLAFQARRHDG
jgi:uncharacterized protein (UPF0210 family)